MFFTLALASFLVHYVSVYGYSESSDGRFLSKIQSLSLTSASLDIATLVTSTESLLTSLQSGHADEKHFFYVYYSDECTTMECHKDLISAHGRAKYSIHDFQLGSVYCTLSELETYAATGVNEKFLNFAPMLATSKVSNEVMNECDGTSKAPTTAESLHVEIAPLSETELAAFKSEFRFIMSSIATSVTGTLEYDEYDLSHFKAETQTNYVKVKSYRDSNCRTVLTAVIDALSNHSMIKMIYKAHDVYTNNAWARSLTQTGIDDNQAITGAGLDGTGQVVGVIDTGIDMSSCYFDGTSTPYNTIDTSQRKVIQYEAYKDSTDDSSSHGTHCAGSVLGLSSDAGSTADYNGMAAQAKLSFFDCNSEGDASLTLPGDLRTGVFDVMTPSGARIFSMSLGTSSNTYTSMPIQCDDYMYNNDDILIVVAAGNDGDNGVSSVGQPGNAKNVLTVGAAMNANEALGAYGTVTLSHLDTEDYLAYFSSRGPCLDGRIKPDVTAPGQYVWSAKGNNGATASSAAHCSIEGFQGTSMATPVTAGNVALIRQYLMDGYYPTGHPIGLNAFTPSGALLKALVIHSTVALIAEIESDSSISSISGYPNNEYGYGAQRIGNVLTFSGHDSSVTSAIVNNPLSVFMIGCTSASVSSLSTINSHMYQSCSSGDSDHSYFFKTGTDTSMPVRVTLVYSDVAGSYTVGSSTNLVNILDIELDRCDSTSTVTDTSRGGGTCNAVESIMGSYLTGSAIINPVAMIDVQTPQANTVYRLKVKCESIPSGPQPYSIVMTQNVTHFPESLADPASVPTQAPGGVDEDNSSKSSGSVDAGAIAAGILVPFFFIALVVGLVYYLYKQWESAKEQEGEAKSFTEYSKDRVNSWCTEVSQTITHCCESISATVSSQASRKNRHSYQIEEGHKQQPKHVSRRTDTLMGIKPDVNSAAGNNGIDGVLHEDARESQYTFNAAYNWGRETFNGFNPFATEVHVNETAQIEEDVRNPMSAKHGEHDYASEIDHDARTEQDYIPAGTEHHQNKAKPVKPVKPDKVKGKKKTRIDYI